MPGVYGLPGSARPTPRFRRAVIALNPFLYYPCDFTGISPAAISDYLGRSTMAAASTPRNDTAPLLDGAKKSVRTNGTSGAWADGTTRDVGTAFTLGIIMSYESGADSPIFSCWNGNGTMLWTNGSSVRIYTRGSNFLSATTVVSGTYLWIATWDGTNASIYKNGALIAGPTSTSGSSAPSQGWALNNYSGGAKDLIARLSDAFLIQRCLTAAEVATLSQTAAILP